MNKYCVSNGELNQRQDILINYDCSFIRLDRRGLTRKHYKIPGDGLFLGCHALSKYNKQFKYVKAVLSYDLKKMQTDLESLECEV